MNTNYCFDRRALHYTSFSGGGKWRSASAAHIRIARFAMGRCFLAVVCLLIQPFSASAEVTSVTVTSRTVVAGGHSFGSTGPYEKLAGRIEFAVDPKDRHHARGPAWPQEVIVIASARRSEEFIKHTLELLCGLLHYNAEEQLRGGQRNKPVIAFEAARIMSGHATALHCGPNPFLIARLSRKVRLDSSSKVPMLEWQEPDRFEIGASVPAKKGAGEMRSAPVRLIWQDPGWWVDAPGGIREGVTAGAALDGDGVQCGFLSGAMLLGHGP